MNWILGLYLFGIFPAFYFAVRHAARTPAIDEAWLFVIAATATWSIWAVLDLAELVVFGIRDGINLLISTERDKTKRAKDARK